MKYLFRVYIVFFICVLLGACGQATQTASVPTATFAPSQTPEIRMETTPTIYVPPTLIPTINPESVPDLLSKAISIQASAGINEHSVQKITGWAYGFRQEACYGYQWLDSNHLLLYPRTGQGQDGFHLGKIDLSSELVVINLTDGRFWLQESLSSTPFSFLGLDCDGIYRSQELGIIISQENSQAVDGSQKEDVIIHTFDGEERARYRGKISGVSPKGTKVMVNDNAIIDLHNNKITNLTWHIDRDKDYSLGISPKLYWSSDETQVYRCCFYYANLNTGKSYNFEWGDLHGPDGKPMPLPMNPYHTGGQWVRNDTYFFPSWDYMSYAGGPTGMFSPTTKKYYFIELSSTPPIDGETRTYTFSPDGMYVWMRGINSGYGTAYGFLSNLTTLETTSYDIDTNEFEWSPDGKFACLRSSPGNSSFPLQTNLLSVPNKKLEPINLNSCSSWRPNDHLLAYFAEEGQVLAIMNPNDMSVKGWKLPSTFIGLIWSPDGNHIALVAKDGSFWRVDYPKMENFEQLTQPMSFTDVRDIIWSPDSTSIAFVKGSDIYIVDTVK